MSVSSENKSAYEIPAGITEKITVSECAIKLSDGNEVVNLNGVKLKPFPTNTKNSKAQKKLCDQIKQKEGGPCDKEHTVSPLFDIDLEFKNYGLTEDVNFADYYKNVCNSKGPHDFPIYELNSVDHESASNNHIEL